jgi:hypothetical protein
MFEVTIYLKSGQSLTVDVTRFVKKKNGLGDLVGLEWNNATIPHARQLFSVDVGQVAAITSTATDESEATDA